MECPVCTVNVVEVEDRVNVQVDTGTAYRFHKNCFDKCARNVSHSKLNPAQLCIFEAESVRNVEYVAGWRCCVVDCTSTERDFVRAECSHALCTFQHMHASCAEKKMEEVVKALRKCRNNSQSADALRKAAFASKYDIVKLMCPCACGHGFFRILNASSAPSVECTPVVPKKTSLHSPKTDSRPKHRSRAPALRMPSSGDSVSRLERSLCESPKVAFVSKSSRSKSSKDAPPKCVQDKQESVAWTLSSCKLEESEAVYYDAMISKLRKRDDAIPCLVGLPPIDPSICPITREVMIDPYDDGTGQRYERIAYKAWIALFGCKPMSGERCG